MASVCIVSVEESLHGIIKTKTVIPLNDMTVLLE